MKLSDLAELFILAHSNFPIIDQSYKGIPITLNFFETVFNIRVQILDTGILLFHH